MFFEGQAGAKKKNILTVFYLATLDLLELLHGCRKVRMLLRTAGIYDYPVFSVTETNAIVNNEEERVYFQSEFHTSCHVRKFSKTSINTAVSLLSERLQRDEDAKLKKM